MNQHYEAAGLAGVDWKALSHDEWTWPYCAWCGSRSGTNPILLRNAMGTPMHLHQCRRCGLRYMAPRPKPIVLEELSRPNLEAIAKRHAAEGCLAGSGEWASAYYRSLLRLADTHFGGFSSVFEVGCGVGWFLHEAERDGKTAMGCDSNHYAMEHAVAKGITAETFQAHSPCIAQFGLVAMLDYIEHSPMPFADLRKARSMLCDGGGILLKTFDDDRDTERRMLAPGVHHYHFTEDVLCRMVEDAGFAAPLIVRDGPGGCMVVVVAKAV